MDRRDAPPVWEQARGFDLGWIERRSINRGLNRSCGRKMQRTGHDAIDTAQTTCMSRKKALSGSRRGLPIFANRRLLLSRLPILNAPAKSSGPASFLCPFYEDRGGQSIHPIGWTIGGACIEQLVLVFQRSNSQRSGPLGSNQPETMLSPTATHQVAEAASPALVCGCDG